MYLLHQSAYSILTPHRFVRLLSGKTSQNWCSPGVVPQIPLEIRSKVRRICVLTLRFTARSASSWGYFPEPVYNFFLLGRLGINVHRGLNVFMLHDRLDDLQVGLFFRKALCRTCAADDVPKSPAAEPLRDAASLLLLPRPHCSLQ